MESYPHFFRRNHFLYVGLVYLTWGLQKNKDGETALSYALSNGFDKHTRMLLDKGAKVDLHDNDGGSVLSNLCLCFKFEKSKKVVDVLVEKGVDLNIKDEDGDTLSSEGMCDMNEKLLAYLKSIMSPFVKTKSKFFFIPPLKLPHVAFL